jgi:hypothetical protein
LYKTSDGGKTWEKILYSDENTGCSDVAIDRQNPDILYAGMWEFRRTPWSFSSGGKGSDLFRPVSQFYHVSTDMADPFNVYGGLQDNGSWYAPSRAAGGISNADWKNVGYGDGFYVYCDKLDSTILYWQFQGGRIARYYKKTGEIPGSGYHLI